MKSLKKILNKRGYIPVKLKTFTVPGSESFHLLIKAELNGVPGIFILDTGASTSVLNIHRRKKFKIKALDNQPEIVAYSASPEKLQVEFSFARKLRIKKWKIKKIPVVLMDLSHIGDMAGASGIDGIIGADILMAAEAVVDYKNLILYLRKKKK
jgi:predicted aspartyl protease